MKLENGPRVGDWVEVLPLAQILDTLDDDGALDALPFMPEMARYAGRRLQVLKSAHKTCDPTGATDLRRLEDAVNLDLRCDGAAHDGCEALCLIIWKNAWLKRVDGPHPEAPPAADAATEPDLAKLHAAIRRIDEKGKTRYRCQVTQIVQATTETRLTDLRPYIDDVSKGNISLGGMLAEFASIAVNGVRRKILRAIGGQAAAAPAEGKELETLNLQPGELVQVRPTEEILATLDQDRKHRGLSVDMEMLRHSGKTFRVAARINRIIDEKTGRMIKFAVPCVALENVFCHGLDNRKRIFCARSPLYYWREAWLRRVDGNGDDRIS
jgi:hypothetical protein